MVKIMEQAVSGDETLHEIADLPPGWIATRNNIGGDWLRKKKMTFNKSINFAPSAPLARSTRRLLRCSNEKVFLDAK